MSDFFVYDLETYPNCFLMTAEHVDAPLSWCFEISDWRDDSKAIIDFVNYLAAIDAVMVSYNGLNFDYPILHMLLQSGGVSARLLYDKAMSIIRTQDENRFAHLVYPNDRRVRQLDLLKLWHYDNKARATSLKALEFAMRMPNISDLPFPVGTALTQEQVPVLKKYNAHDVKATKMFYFQSIEAIRFREDMVAKHPEKDWLNFADVKIGKEMMQMELEKAGVQCYEYGPFGRQPKQTKRTTIVLKDCMPTLQFKQPEFQRVYDYLKAQVITETKGVFTDLEANVNGLTYVFGTGGIHASVENRYFEANDEYTILDLDVTSLYPSIAITQGFYPEHLGKGFVHIYAAMKNRRLQYKKGTVENAALKLALNGTYGASNDKFSVFYDPKFTMQITLTGQMLIALLVEQLSEHSQVIQGNTDGISLWTRRDSMHVIEDVYKKWEKLSMLELERVEYKQMAIRDVNNYLAVKTDGSVKRKGAYEYEMEWHQNHSALVVAKVAEEVLLEGVGIRETVMNWPDIQDFMLMIKVPRSSYLMWGEERVQNATRYYVTKKGAPLVKVMPPLAKKPDVWRRIGVESGWNVTVCNDIEDAVDEPDYDYYVREVEKLTLKVM